MNKTDLKIISSLEENGRISYVQLARSIGISVSVVSKRIEALIKSGVLSIKAVPNPYKIGYSANAIIGLNVAYDKMDDVCKYLKSILNVNMIVTTFGRFNIILAVYFKSLDRLYNFISEGLSAQDGIEETEIFFVKDIRKRYDGISYSNFPNDRHQYKIDDTDEKIIEHLTENGRYSCAFISEKLGISISSVSKRLFRLLKDDIIKIQARTDPLVLGYQQNAFFLIRGEQNKINDIFSNLRPYQQVITLMSLANGYDIFAIIVEKNSETLNQFVKRELTSAAGVTHVDILNRGELIKRYYGAYHIDKMLINNM